MASISNEFRKVRWSVARNEKQIKGYAQIFAINDKHTKGSFESAFQNQRAPLEYKQIKYNKLRTRTIPIQWHEFLWLRIQTNHLPFFFFNSFVFLFQWENIWPVSRILMVFLHQVLDLNSCYDYLH